MDISEGKITYKAVTLPETETGGIASILGYDEENREWYVYRIPHINVKSKERFEKAGLQVYFPTYTVETVRFGHKVKEEKPKILNYLFVLADRKSVDKFSALEGINPVYRHHAPDERISDARKWLTVPAAQMHSLMIVAQGYEQEIEFCTPDDQRLEKGDKVRVDEGQFKGLEGILLSDQRAGGGRVYVSITNGLGVKSIHIPDRNIKVLEVSRSSNRFFRQIQAFEQVMDEVIELRRQGKPITDKLKAELYFFLYRYSELAGLTFVSKAKLTTCRYVAYTLLYRSADAEHCLQQFEAETQSDKNSRRAATRYSTARQYMDTWLEKLASLR